MHPALFRRGAALPPPSARPRWLSRSNRAGAWRAADAAKALLVERVAGHVVCPDVCPDLFLVPARKRVELDDTAMLQVLLHLANPNASAPLVTAQAGDPGVQAAEHARQRKDLAYLTAPQAQWYRTVKQIWTIRPKQGLKLVWLWYVDLEIQSVTVANLVHHVVGLLRQPTGVDREDAYK